MSEVKIEDLKDYQFAYDKLDDKFAKLQEDGKIAFCRAVKEGWNTPIREIFEEVLRQFYNEAALSAKTLDELNALRQAIIMFMTFKQRIEGKISLFNQKVQRDDSSSSSLKNL